MKIASPSSRFRVWLLMALALPASVSGSGSDGANPVRLSKTEEYVTNVLSIGVVANLSTNISTYEADSLKEVESFRLQFANEHDLAVFKRQFGDKAACALSSRFLEDLLTTTNYFIHRHGIRIIGGVVTNRLDVKHADIPSETWLDEFRFEDDVDFSRSVFHKSLSLAGSIFQRKADWNGANVGFDLILDQATFDGPANLNGTVVARLATWSNTVFNGSLNCRYASFGNLRCGDSRFNGGMNQAQFISMRVGRSANFSRTIFAGVADFNHAEIAEEFHAEGTEFANPTQTVSFLAMKVGSYAWFTNAVFSGPAMFSHAEIGRNLECDRVGFTNRDATIDFSDIKVGGAALFRNARFAGGSNFRHADIGLDLTADSARFTNSRKTADFTDLKVKQSVSYTNAVFAGTVDFTEAEISRDYMADGAVFGNSIRTDDFSGMSIGGEASFTGAIFKGPVEFYQMTVGRDFSADAAQFTEASFSTLKVGGDAYFTWASFDGTVTFERAGFGRDLYLTGVQFSRQNNGQGLHGPAFTRMKVAGAAYLDGATFAEPVSMSQTAMEQLDVRGSKFTDRGGTNDFSLMRVAGDAHFEGAVLSGMVDFAFADIGGRLYADKKCFAVPPHLTGMGFREINAGDSEGSCSNLLDLLIRSEFADDVYENAEAALRRGGHPDLADAVFIQREEHKRSKTLTSRDFDWWWNQFLDEFVKYGRSPRRAEFWSIVILLIGWGLFRKKYMKGKKQDDQIRYEKCYSAFWYSLDLFLPFIDLEAKSSFEPRENRRFLRLWARVHKILGWALIPIALAAWTGLVK